MGAGNNVLNITGGVASVLGSITGGTGGTSVMTINPGAGNSFSYSGSISNFNTVEAKSGNITLSGANAYTGKTLVSGGILTLDGANRISAGSALDLEGGTLELIGINIANGQTFASLNLGANSTIDLDFNTSLTFNSLAGYIVGNSLAILDWNGITSPDYAFRFIGDYTTDASFLALLSSTTINGLVSESHFDGVFTNVAPVPEPSAFCIGLALAGVACGRRRRGPVSQS